MNEILFERIFRQASLAWFEAYLLQHSMIKEAGISAERLHTQVSECVYGALSAGTTFRFEIQRLNAADEAAPDNRSTYPVYGVAAFAVTVLLSVVLGVLCAVVTAVSAYLLRRGN